MENPLKQTATAEKIIMGNKSYKFIFSKRTYKYLIGLGFLFASENNLAFGQTRPFPTLVTSFKEHSQRAVHEKIFLHLDRPAYASGETMWFKLYSVDGTQHQFLALSKVAYVEVLDSGQKPILQGKISLKEGMGSGSFVLPVTLAAGNYTIRAYTNWMKNFSPDFYFEQPVTIINTFQPLGLSPVSDSAAYSIQFYPEGGDLINGLPAKVAFKGINDVNGKGVVYAGELQDKAGNVIATLQPTKAGIGNFSFTPSNSEEYQALVRFPNGQVVRQKLPQVKEEGYSLHLQEKAPGQLEITAYSTTQQPENLYLLGHTRNAVVVAGSAIMANGKASFSVAKDSLLAGITHFTLFNSQQKPVSERLYFTRPTTVLEIETTLAKNQFGTREKVDLALVTKGLSGNATPANLSLSVFKLDSLGQGDVTDIRAYLYLKSDLKGTVEQAASYLTETGPQADEALDNLMLTHGWSRFTWQEVINPDTVNYTFIPEYQGHLIKGKITHRVTGGPAKGIRTYFSSASKNVRFYSSVSTDSGAVLFDVKDFFGLKEVVVQTNFALDSTYNFQLFTPFSEKFSAYNQRPFDISERQQEDLHFRHLNVQAQNIFNENFLNRYLTPSVDSLPFYGKPSERYLLDDFTRFKVMEEVMREYVPGVMVRKRRDGFHFLVHNQPRKLFFQDNPLVLLDGVPVFDINKIMAFDPLKVQKLDVITGTYYTGSLSSAGVVSYMTYKGDLAGFPLDTRALLQEYEGLQLQREFYAPSYESEEQKLSRLPDWRNLLYWNPNLVTDSNGKANTHFFTSDLPGTYTLVVQGLTPSGLPGSKTITFEVRKPL